MALTVWALPSLIALLLNSALGIYVLRRNPGNPVNRAFAAFAGFLALWDFGEFGLRIAADAATALLWARIEFLGILFISPAFAYFVFRLLEKRISAALLYAPFALFLLALPTDLFIKDVALRPWGYGHYYGILFVPFGALLSAVGSYALYLLWKARGAVKNPLTRRKLDLMLYPAIIAQSFGGITDILLPILGIYPYATTSLLTVFMALGIAYAFTVKE